MPRSRANTTMATMAPPIGPPSSNTPSSIPLPPPPPLPPTLSASSNISLNRHLDSPRSHALKLPSIRFVPHNDNRSSRPSLSFPPVTRMLPDASAIIRVGRYSERDNNADVPPNLPSAAPIGFKSKVVSRRHCEFFFKDAQWFIKDVKSSSGTFLNHIRLSPPGTESRPYPIKDGDVVQLGIDFKGGEEMIFRCVKILIFCNKGSHRAANNFNKSAHKHLQNLAKTTATSLGDRPKNSTECTICLNSIAPCQALFVAPCSHTWHYKCIRPLLEDPQHPSFRYPHFLCPNCRTIADLEADVDEPIAWESSSEVDEDIESSNDPTVESQAHPNSLPIDVMDTSPKAAPNLSQDEGLPADERISPSSARPSKPMTPTRVRPSRTTSTSARIVSSSPVTAAAPQLTIDDRLFNHTEAAATEWSLHRDTSNGFSSFSGLSLPNWSIDPPRDDAGGMHTMLSSTGGSDRKDDSDNGAGLIRSLTGLEGPLTPRNNVGPFVFDGSTGASPEPIEHEMTGSSNSPNPAPAAP